MLTIIEWMGCALGVLGAGLLAMNNRWSGYGFVLFLGSNVAWIVFGVLTGAMGLVTMQIVFTMTSMVGIWQWLIRPHIEARRVLARAALGSLRGDHAAKAYAQRKD